MSSHSHGFSWTGDHQHISGVLQKDTSTATAPFGRSPIKYTAYRTGQEDNSNYYSPLTSQAKIEISKDTDSTTPTFTGKEATTGECDGNTEDSISKGTFKGETEETGKTGSNSTLTLS